MNKRYVNKNTGIIAFQFSQPCNAKYLVVVANRGMTSEVHNFRSFKDAKREFGKIARYHRYKPSEINGSDYYHVSMWEWTEDSYEKIHGY